MPHIDGKTDDAVLFGFGYCQAEDFFWQIEDSYVMGLGRYAELYGKQFIAQGHSQSRLRDSAAIAGRFREARSQAAAHWARPLSQASTIISTRTRARSRGLLKRFEPWYLLAFARAATLELVGGHMHVPGGDVPTSFGEQSCKQKSVPPRVATPWPLPAAGRARASHAVHQSASALLRLWSVLRSPSAQRRGLELSRAIRSSVRLRWRLGTTNTAGGASPPTSRTW